MFWVVISSFRSTYIFKHSTIHLGRTATMDNERTYEVPSLLKTAYHACNKLERAKFDLLYAPVDMQYCCESLFEILKIDKNQDAGNDRQTMFSRSLFAINDKGFKNICEGAAFYGHINCLKLAHEIGVPWNEMSLANYNACARKNNCPWDEETCSIVTRSHFNCLIYGREKGCSLNKDNCQYVAWNRQMHYVKYLRENLCSCNSLDCPRNGWVNAPDKHLCSSVRPRTPPQWTGAETASWFTLRKISTQGASQFFITRTQVIFYRLCFYTHRPSFYYDFMLHVLWVCFIPVYFVSC